MLIESWMVRTPGEPMVRETRDESPGPAEVIVRVAGCGVCHTDLGFHYEGVPTRHGFPLTLGHEVSGTVADAGDAAKSWVGKRVVVPAVIPCGECAACREGHGSVCPAQIFPGNDVHGGFGTHLRVPARGLCEVPDLDDRARNPHGVDLSSLSVIADAVSTPYQAILRSALHDGDLAIFIGVGGVGGFGVQLAAAMGAQVAAIDVDEQRLELASEHGATLAVEASAGFKAIRDAVRRFADKHSIPTWRWKIFETSGTDAGQGTAFGLVGHGSYLSVVGFTPKKVELRLSNLMAFDATAQGNWGCLPEHYPSVVDLVLQGKVVLEPYVERRPLSSINETFAELNRLGANRRVILTPEA